MSGKSAVSNVCGSFNDDEELSQMETIDEDKEVCPANLEDARKILHDEWKSLYQQRKHLERKVIVIHICFYLSIHAFKIS